jgi:hypothetical protein
MESFLTEQEKAGLSARRVLLNPVESRGLSNGRKTAHLPEATKLLLRKYYFSDGKEPASAVA